METGTVTDKAGQSQVVVEIQDSIISTKTEEESLVVKEINPSASPARGAIPVQSAGAATPTTPSSSSMRYRKITRSGHSKPKSRVLEPPLLNVPKAAELPVPPATELKSPSTKVASPNSQKISAPITPRTPLMASVEENDDDDDDGDEDVYQAQTVEPEKTKQEKKVKVLFIIEWIIFASLMTVLIASLLVNRLRDFHIWSLSLWRWCIFGLVIFCGHLFTEWLMNAIVFSIEKIFLLKKKLLYFLFALKKSMRVVIWLALILMAWCLLINNRAVHRSERTSRILDYITRALASSLVGAVLYTVKTFVVKLVASRFHVRTYFDRIQESIFHQYILQALSGILTENQSGQLSFRKMAMGKVGTQEEVINVDKLYRMKREKVSAWTMGGLIQVIRQSGLPTFVSLMDDIEEESRETKEITSEAEAINAANKIFKKLAKPGNNFIEEDDLLVYMPEEEVKYAIPLFEGAAETRRIKRSAFRNWVVKSYKERKCLALSLNDAKTAIEELNKIATAIALVVILIVWLLLMEITTNRVLVFIFSQILLVVFVFGDSAKRVFEAGIFVFVVHPFDVGDRCVVDGVEMTVDEMNILTTVFLKSDNEKVYYPNSELSTKPIGNFNRSPEMMGDSVEFGVDFSTSVEAIASLKERIKKYVESKPQHWCPAHSVQLKEIVNMDKLVLGVYLTHTRNFQNSGRGGRISDFIFELKKIFEELGIGYHLLPQEVRVRYVDGT